METTKPKAQDNVIFCGHRFPRSYIKDHKTFTTEVELGEGQFGAVYQGHLDIG